MPFFQDARTLTIPALGSVDYELPGPPVPLDNLTIWIFMAQPAQAITAQPVIGDGPNAVNLGGATVIPNTGPFSGPVFLSNNPTDGRRLIPENKGPAGARPFRFKVNLSNLVPGAAAEVVTVYATANELAFGA